MVQTVMSGDVGGREAEVGVNTMDVVLLLLASFLRGAVNEELSLLLLSL